MKENAHSGAHALTGLTFYSFGNNVLITKRYDISK